MLLFLPYSDPPGVSLSTLSSTSVSVLNLLDFKPVPDQGLTLQERVIKIIKSVCLTVPSLTISLCISIPGVK